MFLQRGVPHITVRVSGAVVNVWSTTSRDVTPKVHYGVTKVLSETLQREVPHISCSETGRSLPSPVESSKETSGDDGGVILPSK